jgi:nicotinate-nucleotide adenylyltransferase
VNQRIGLFGGSFDPVHHGHLLAARALREVLALDAVWLVPAGTQPFKAGRHAAPAADRVAMVELAVTGEPGFAVDSVEVEREGPSYTVDTVRALQARHRSVEFLVLVGSDAAAELPLWKESTALRELAEIVVYRRAGASAPPAGLRVVTVPQVELSATAIRARVAAGQSIRYLVPDRVAEYIAARRLYV